MKKEELDEWKLDKKAEVYELFAKGAINKVEYRDRLDLIELIV